MHTHTHTAWACRCRRFYVSLLSYGEIFHQCLFPVLGLRFVLYAQEKLYYFFVHPRYIHGRSVNTTCTTIQSMFSSPQAHTPANECNSVCLFVSEAVFVWMNVLQVRISFADKWQESPDSDGRIKDSFLMVSREDLVCILSARPEPRTFRSSTGVPWNVVLKKMSFLATTAQKFQLILIFMRTTFMSAYLFQAFQYLLC